MVCSKKIDGPSSPEENHEFRLLAAAPDLAATLSLFLRTYYDGTRHGFTPTWVENMEEAASQARAILSRV